MENSLPVYAPDGAEKALSAQEYMPISVAAPGGRAGGRPKYTVSATPGAPLIQFAPFNWTPVTNPTPSFGYTTSGDVGATGLVFNQAASGSGWSMADFSDLQTISFPNLSAIGSGAVGVFSFTTQSNPSVSLVSCSAPLLTYVGNHVLFVNCVNLTTLNLPVLASTEGEFDVSGCTSLTSISLPAYATSDFITISGCTVLASVSLPALTSSTTGVTIENNAALTTVSLPLVVPGSGQVFNFSGNALTQACVNAILEQFAAVTAWSSGTLDLNGGTNAAPSGGGAAAVTTLQGRGITVNHN